MTSDNHSSKPLTIKDIAQLAGVSIATVSKVINQKDDDIGENTRKKILEIIEKHNYVPYRHIRKRIAAKSSMLGLVIADESCRFSQSFVRGVEARAYEEKMSVIICHVGRAADDNERLIEHLQLLRDRNVEGVIIAPSNRLSRADVMMFSEDHTPLVVVDERTFDDDISHVHLDDEMGSYEATRCLIQKGHEVIGLISSRFEGDASAMQKLEGYKRALYDHHMSFNSNFVFEGTATDFRHIGYEGASFLLSLGVTGIVASDDRIASGIYLAAHEMSLQVPGDLSVVGYGNLPLGEHMMPPLTTVSFPFYDIGYESCAQLLKKINKKASERHFAYQPTLINRRSVTSPKKIDGMKERIVIVGSLNMDLIMRVPHIPRIGETVLANDIKVSAGGKGANQAVGAGRLGGKVSMIGRVGNDLYGRELFNGLVNNGVDASAVVYDDMLPTGNANIYVAPNGDNNIVVNPGANSRLSIEQVDNFEAMFDKASYCLIQMEIPMDTIEHVATICRNKQIKLILNPAPAQKLNYDYFKDCYLVVPNETEIDLMIPGDLSIEEKAQALLQKGFQNVIVTLGEKGCLLVNDEVMEYFPAATFRVVDTTGAGDSFISGLTVALSEGKTMQEAIRFASVAAGITVSREGAQPSLPDREAVEEYLKEGAS